MATINGFSQMKMAQKHSHVQAMVDDGPEMDFRDPNGLNDHVKVEYGTHFYLHKCVI